jgi:L-amino acid N-acyltransferase YncA
MAFVIDPLIRRRGLGRLMIRAMMSRPELSSVGLFKAGVELENVASIRCLLAAGFQSYKREPDYEGMLYYMLHR